MTSATEQYYRSHQKAIQYLSNRFDIRPSWWTIVPNGNDMDSVVRAWTDFQQFLRDRFPDKRSEIEQALREVRDMVALGWLGDD